jgi:hypothetical protein
MAFERVVPAILSNHKNCPASQFSLVLFDTLCHCDNYKITETVGERIGKRSGNNNDK